MLDEFGAVQALPRESAGDLVRIAGVTPGGPPRRHHGRGVRRYAADDPAVATLLTTAHPSRPVPILGAPRHQPAWAAVGP